MWNKRRRLNSMRNGAGRNYHRIIDAYRINSCRNTFVGYQRCHDAEEKRINGHEAYHCPETPQSPFYHLDMSQFIWLNVQFRNNIIVLRRKRKSQLYDQNIFSSSCKQRIARVSKQTKDDSFPSRLSTYVNYKRYFNDHRILYHFAEWKLLHFSQTLLSTLDTWNVDSIYCFKCNGQFA